MKRLTRVVMPCLAFAALLAACDNTDNTTGISTTTTANVRFVNAISNASGNLALTANGSMVGSSQPFASSGNSFSCTTIPAGTNSLAFGTANTGGTAIASSLGTMSSTFASGGNYTLIATGTSSNPRLLVLNNAATSAAASGFANVQFVNATSVPVDFFTNASGTTNLNTPTTGGTAAFANGSFTQVPIGNSSLTFTQAGTASPLYTTNLSTQFSSGGNYTVLLLPGAGGVGFQSIVLGGGC